MGVMTNRCKCADIFRSYVAANEEPQVNGIHHATIAAAAVRPPRCLLTYSLLLGWRLHLHQVNICWNTMMNVHWIGGHTHTHTHPFNGPFSWLPGWASTRKIKPIWILLKQETVSGSGISWAICKSAPCSRQGADLKVSQTAASCKLATTMPAPHHSSFLQAGCPSCRPTNSVKALKAISQVNEKPVNAL